MARPPKRVAVPIWSSAPYELADAMALKALMAGTADPQQQQRAFHWITRTAARVNRMSFDPAGERESTFAEGRRFVGLQIMRLATASVETLKAEIATTTRTTDER